MWNIYYAAAVVQGGAGAGGKSPPPIYALIKAKGMNLSQLWGYVWPMDLDLEQSPSIDRVASAEAYAPFDLPAFVSS